MQRTIEINSIINQDYIITPDIWCASYISWNNKEQFGGRLIIDGINLDDPFDGNNEYTYNLIEAKFYRDPTNKIIIKCKQANGQQQKILIELLTNLKKYTSKDAQIITFRLDRFQVDHLLEVIQNDIQNANNSILIYDDYVKKSSSENSSISIQPAFMDDDSINFKRTNELQWPIQKILQLKLYGDETSSHLKSKVNFIEVEKKINQCKMELIASGEYLILDLMKSLKDMSTAYRNDYKLFSNTHDNIAEKFISIIDHLETDYKIRSVTTNPTFYFEIAQCMVIALQEFLTKEKSDKYQKHLTLIYEKYTELKIHSSLLETNYRNEINGIKDYITAKNQSVTYNALELDSFKMKYNNLHGIQINNMDNKDLSRFTIKK
jgi:hypothetical protein